ncbi:helix-turn-helix transcriptional regulator [uncultured Fusobacterium sp.]|uniref:helix-turn-helix domain-containing protein n=1 Tax=uncultured Fusobacterium sp. TaxID=159267 RepID=UPI0025999028|nr:helix-turn-helix transcriptional regulator [uncultured Fusobacterium sp.]
MINITLSRYLGDKRIKQSELSRISNVNKNTISALYNNETKRIDLEVLNKICNSLNCHLTDILEYIPDDDSNTTD